MLTHVTELGLRPESFSNTGQRNLVAVAGRDRELLALELLGGLDGRVAPHEDAVGRAPVPQRDGLHLHVRVGARRDERGDVRDAHVALAGRDALHGVARALAAEDLHVEALVAIEALLQRGVVRHVLAGGHEVEDEGVGRSGFGCAPPGPGRSAATARVATRSAGNARATRIMSSSVAVTWQ
jgi:hypothetical protein